MSRHVILSPSTSRLACPLTPPKVESNATSARLPVLVPRKFVSPGAAQSIRLPCCVM
ncbi:TPA: hypothetical protein PTW02_003087 [Cronobacter sakazakii]|nr:hypothetical protein [Cronobacter sakazakii]